MAEQRREELALGRDAADSDLAYLRRRDQLPRSASRRRASVVDLFAGCGGLTLGLSEAAGRQGLDLDISLAVDTDPAACSVFAHNFPAASVECCPVEELIDGSLYSEKLTHQEQYTRDRIGAVDILVGGPPCQGHSDLNNHTRRTDPKNRLYLTMARAAQVIRPEIVVVENVPAVRHDHEGVVQEAESALSKCGYDVHARVLDLHTLGVPQRRKRHVLLALRSGGSRAADILSVLQRQHAAEERTVRWAIGDLEAHGDQALHSPSRLSSQNRDRIEWLFDNDVYDLPNKLRPICHQGDHSYRSMYGRLNWDLPAQTITTGFGSMGQGRFVHPSLQRTLTPREAARIQFFPDWFDFTAGGIESRRGAWSRMIGNAAPPKLTMAIGSVALAELSL